MKRFKGKIAHLGYAVIGILAVLLVGGYIAYASIWKIPGLRYEFSDGFRGWVVIQYGDPRGEPLPVREGFYIFRIPPSGCFRTASPQPDGFRKVVYQYVTPDDQRREIIEDKENPMGQIWSHDIHGGYEPGGEGLYGKYSLWEHIARFPGFLSFLPSINICCASRSSSNLNTQSCPYPVVVSLCGSRFRLTSCIHPQSSQNASSAYSPTNFLISARSDSWCSDAQVSSCGNR
jgi:hypothetical protein